MKPRNPIFWALIVILAVGISSLAFAAMTDKEKKTAREEVQKMTKETLERLYKAQPSAKQAVAKSAGYAVFSNFGLKIFVAGSGKGEGLAVNNATKAVTYMKMFEVQAGLGIGVKKFRLVWVFEKQKDLRNFIKSGWELGSRPRGRPNRGEGGCFPGSHVRFPGDLALSVDG